MTIFVFVVFLEELFNFFCHVFIFSFLVLFHCLIENKLFGRLFCPLFLAINNNSRISLLILPPLIHSCIKLICNSLCISQLYLSIVFLLLVYVLLYLFVETLVDLLAILLWILYSQFILHSFDHILFLIICSKN